MKCSECGGSIISLQHGVYRPDGSSSGVYRCQECGREKSWFVQGHGEPVMDMSSSCSSSNSSKDGKA